MQPYINTIIKLKLLKLLKLLKTTNNGAKCFLLYAILNYSSICLLKFSKLIFYTGNSGALTIYNFLNIGLYSSKNYYKNYSYLNLFTFYNLIHKLYNSELVGNKKSLECISNYNSKYLYIYYYCYVRNVKLGISKYFTSFYQNNLFFIRFFILKYITTFIDYKKTYLSLQKNNINIFEKKTLFKVLLKKTWYLRSLNETNLKIKSFLNLILVSLFSKDVILLKNGIKNILEQLHFKKHRKFLYNLKLLLKVLTYIFFYKFNCLGIYIKVKGKIGVGGNLKKRKFNFKLGSFSFTRKSQKLNYVKDNIHTYSGVLGFEIYLSYK